MLVILIIFMFITAEATLTVNELRQLLLREDTSQFNPQDIEMMKTRDIWVQGFIDDNDGNTDRALKQLYKAMKWRKTFRINEFNETSFPQELYKIGYIFPYGKGTGGEYVIIFRTWVTKKFPEKWNLVLKQFIAYRLEVASKSYYNNITLIVDYANKTVDRINIELFLFFLFDIRQHYPALVKYCLIIYLPDFKPRHFFIGPVTAAVKAMMELLPRKYQDVKLMVDHDELNRFVANDQLPVVMGGSNKEPINTVPAEAPTAIDFGKSRGIPESDTEKVIEYMNQFY